MGQCGSTAAGPPKVAAPQPKASSNVKQTQSASAAPAPGHSELPSNVSTPVATANIQQKSNSNEGTKQGVEQSLDSKVEPSKASVTGTKTWVIGKTADIRTVYEFSQVLGKGQFGTTRLCTHRETGDKAACKSISKRKLTTPEDVEDVRREVQILYHLAGHENVVQMKAVYEDKQYVHIVMEVASGGELFDRIVERGHYSEKDASTVFRTMVGVIDHCHNMCVMHRDLKPENFLLADKSPEAKLKATDFGLSVFFKEGEVFREIVGSAYYVAPEVLKRSYGKEADIWSLGVMLYILLCGVPPFYGDNETQIFQEVLTGRLDLDSNPWPEVSVAAKELVRALLMREPSKRLTAQQVLAHPWVRVDGVASAQPIKHEVLTRIQGFAAMHKLKKEALKIIAGFLPEDQIRGLRELFLSLDTDNSGTITVEELRDGLRKKGTNIPESELQKLVANADVNHNGTIDYEEFLAATIHQSKLQQEENLYKAFQVLDKDGSGFITRDELVESLSKYGLEDLDQIISQVDSSGDGQIDYTEFCAMMLSNSEQLGGGAGAMAGVNVRDRNVKIEGDRVIASLPSKKHK